MSLTAPSAVQAALAQRERSEVSIMSRRKFWFNLFLVLIGIVLGTFVGAICKDVSFLSWLNYGLNFGMTTPLTLDLNVINLTFALSLDLTLSVIIFIILSLIVGRAITK